MLTAPLLLRGRPPHHSMPIHLLMQRSLFGTLLTSDEGGVMTGTDYLILAEGGSVDGVSAPARNAFEALATVHALRKTWPIVLVVDGEGHIRDEAALRRKAVMLQSAA